MLTDMPTDTTIPTTETTTIPTPVQELPVVTTPSITPPPNKSGAKVGFIVVGIIVLLIAITGGVLFFTLNNTNQEAAAPAPVVNTPVKKSLAITIDQIQDGDVSNTKTLKVTGTTNVASTVTVVGGSDDVIFETTDGNFSVDVPLSNGENKLIFTAQDQNDNQVTATRSILYSEEKI